MLYEYRKRKYTALRSSAERILGKVSAGFLLWEYDLRLKFSKQNLFSDDRVKLNLLTIDYGETDRCYIDDSSR